ncbi:MAG: LysM peptidoglycan-binding domain-containing protein [Anaerolineales bacterium]|nr:LysM peptidoglycan-binding domain-containing protein [Anaerolineales bacterium]
MSLQDKYRSVLDLGMKFGVKDGYVKEEDGKLKIGGTTVTQYEKDKMWDQIKAANLGSMPTDLVADIKVSNTDYYHKHIVEKGESLSKIAKHYYDDPMKYMLIFNANTGILKDPDVIQPGQELVIPFDK